MVRYVRNIQGNQVMTNYYLPIHGIIEIIRHFFHHAFKVFGVPKIISLAQGKHQALEHVVSHTFLNLEAWWTLMVWLSAESYTLILCYSSINTGGVFSMSSLCSDFLFPRELPLRTYAGSLGLMEGGEGEMHWGSWL